MNDPTLPATWLRYARSNLQLADQGVNVSDVLFEDLCFNAQQAAEKALKAVCVAHQIDFPKTHSLVHLMDQLTTNGIEIPEDILVTSILTQYAVQTRYPGWAEEITPDEYKEAVMLAARVVFWAENLIEQS